MDNKRVLSIGLAASIMMSSVSVFAAPGDFYKIPNYTEPEYKAVKVLRDKAALRDVMSNEEKFVYEGKNNKAYEIKKANKVYEEVNGDTKKFLEELDKEEGVAVGENGQEELEDITIETSPEILEANGKTIMEVEVKLNTPNADKMGGMVEINSKLGLKASKVEEALDKGVAKFKIQLPTSVKNLNDVITATVKSHDVVEGIEQNELVGMNISKEVVYEAMGTEGGGSQEVVRTYEVSDVRSMDMADRVAVYVGMQDAVDLDDVKAAVKDQVKLYNKNDGSKKINIIKIEEVIEVKGGYAFISLIELKDGKKENVLYDNQYNYYSVEKPTKVAVEGENNISLKEKEFHKDNRFMLIDGKRPEVRTVKTTLNDNKFLPNDSILVEFNEPVNRETSENPKNWTINGKNLAEFDGAKEITLIDVEEAYPAGEAPKWTAISEGKERNAVIIELRPSFARSEMKNGQRNLLQVKSVADWAGMTDLSDNNKISTQDFTFMYDVPEVELGLTLETQSPEQFVLNLGDVLYTDEDLKNKFDFSKDIEVTLEGKNKKGVEFTEKLDPADYKVRAVDDNFVLELTKDWTKILKDTDINAYHGKTFKVAITGDTFNVYGEQVTGKVDGKDKVMDAKVILREDTKSPFIEKHELLTTKDTDLVNGDIKITMNEPVQLVDPADRDKALTKPELTPSEEQEKVSEQSFEYVQIEDKEGKVSKGIRVGGKVKDGSVDPYDMEFTVTPESALEAGEWKLVVRSISDDVGNTMKTEEVITFTIDGKAPEVVQDMKVEPYLVWGYVLDDKEPTKTKAADAKELDNDYVVLLFSREMDIEVLQSGTYSINGKAIDQDAKITDELIPVYKNTKAEDKDELHGKGNNKDKTNVEQWMAHLITIELPKDFIVSKETKHALTLPQGLAAVDDKVEGTKDTLLGGTQFELMLERYEELVDGKVLPGFVKDELKKAEDHKEALIKELQEDGEKPGVTDPKVFDTEDEAKAAIKGIVGETYKDEAAAKAAAEKAGLVVLESEVTTEPTVDAEGEAKLNLQAEYKLTTKADEKTKTLQKEVTVKLDKLEDEGTGETPEEAAKAALEESIKAAEAALTTVEADKKAALEKAIKTAKGVAEKADATEADLKAAKTALDKAVKDAGVEAKEVETVAAKIDKATIKVEETATITATGKDSEGNEVADAEFTYASDKEEIAKVSDEGVVTGVAEGKATITVTSNGKTATVEVTVEPKEEAKEVETVAAKIDKATIKVEETATITATGKDSEGNEVADAEFTYASDKEEIAKVSDEGVVTGVAEGKATITITSNEKTATVEVTVEPKEDADQKKVDEAIEKIATITFDEIAKDKNSEDAAKEAVIGKIATETGLEKSEIELKDVNFVESESGKAGSIKFKVKVTVNGKTKTSEELEAKIEKQD